MIQRKIELVQTDQKIRQHLIADSPRSFILYAGAGAGKTHSLHLAIEYLLESKGEKLARRGQSIAVVTFTNAAAEEVAQRVRYHPLAKVSTIHSFSWNLIKDFQVDIRTSLTTKLEAEIAELVMDSQKGTKAKVEKNKEKIRRKTERLNVARSATKFIYSPDGDNLELHSLNHTEVIDFMVTFLREHQNFQKVLVGRYPYFFVDETQDTDKNLMAELINVSNSNSHSFCLGLFGDTMQRIYQGGLANLSSYLHDDWEHFAKTVNYRSASRIISLANTIRSTVDDHQQTPRDGAPDGIVRLFISSAQSAPEAIEAEALSQMATITGDTQWGLLHFAGAGSGVKKLVLEHTMAAHRLGFSELFEYFRGLVGKDNQMLIDNRHRDIRFLTSQLVPLIRAIDGGDDYQIMELMKRYSPLLLAGEDQSTGGSILSRAHISQLRAGVKKLRCMLLSDSRPSVAEILPIIASFNIFRLPHSITDALQHKEPHNDTTDTTIFNWFGALNCGVDELLEYENYINGRSEFDTHQGVKGLEFQRVMVVINDSEAGGNFFSYEKLFGAKRLSTTDLKNKEEGRETTLDRTRRLFYVTCTRAIESLAVVLYSERPDLAREYFLDHGLFLDNEIVLLEGART